MATLIFNTKIDCTLFKFRIAYLGFDQYVPTRCYHIAFFFLIYRKRNVYANKPEPIEELKRNISENMNEQKNL